MSTWRTFTVKVILLALAIGAMLIAMQHLTWDTMGRARHSDRQMAPAVTEAVARGLITLPDPQRKAEVTAHFAQAAGRVGDHLAINPVWPALAFVLCITGLVLLAQPRKHPADPFPAP